MEVEPKAQRKEEEEDDEPTPYLQHPLSLEQEQRCRANAVKRSTHPFGLTPENQAHGLPLYHDEEEVEEQQIPPLYGTMGYFRRSPSWIPYVFPSPRPSHQYDWRLLSEIVGATEDEANAKSASHNNLGMPNEDVVYKVLKPLPYGTSSDGKGPGPWRAFSATCIRYPYGSGGTEPVVEKVENYNPATDFMVETTVATSGAEEDVGLPLALAQMSKEGPFLKRCKSVGSNLS